MIATVIMALAATATMAIIAGAKSNIIRAQERWYNQHITTSVVEYYLLASHLGSSPTDLMPNGWSASCELLEVDDIHEDAQEAIRGWIIGQFLITITDEHGDLVSETPIYKVIKEDDF